MSINTSLVSPITGLVVLIDTCFKEHTHGIAPDAEIV